MSGRPWACPLCRGRRVDVALPLGVRERSQHAKTRSLRAARVTDVRVQVLCVCLRCQARWWSSHREAVARASVGRAS